MTVWHFSFERTIKFSIGSFGNDNNFICNTTSTILSDVGLSISSGLEGLIGDSIGDLIGDPIGDSISWLLFGVRGGSFCKSKFGVNGLVVLDDLGVSTSVNGDSCSGLFFKKKIQIFVEIFFKEKRKAKGWNVTLDSV